MHSKRTEKTPSPGPEPTSVRDGGLWWLWLISDQALIGAARRPAQPAPEPDAATARSWALADLALEQLEGQ